DPAGECSACGARASGAPGGLEPCGPLGPKGVLTCRVLAQKKPRRVYIGVREDQLEVLHGACALTHSSCVGSQDLEPDVPGSSVPQTSRFSSPFRVENDLPASCLCAIRSTMFNCAETKQGGASTELTPPWPSPPVGRCLTTGPCPAPWRWSAA